MSFSKLNEVIDMFFSNNSGILIEKKWNRRIQISELEIEKYRI